MKSIANTSWSLISEGKFNEAIIQATEEYVATESLISLRHRAISNILLKDYNNALMDFEEVIIKTEDIYKGDTDYIYMGVLYWLLKDYEHASKYWIDSLTLRLRYTSNIVIPPAIVYFAGVYLKDNKLIKEANKYLKRRWKSRIPLAGFLLNEISAEDLLKTIESDSPMKSRTLCKYEFYIATKCLQRENKEEYFEHLRKCVVAKGNYLEFEYFIATVELQ